MFRRFGSEVTIVQSAARLLMIEDEDVRVDDRGKLTCTAMADAIFTHSLLAEGINTLFATLDA
jgi:citrate lyase gamma subunit